MAKKGQSTLLNDDLDFEDVSIQELNARKPSGSELEQLRDILFGNQARSTEDRLNRLERSLETSRQQLQDLFSQRLDGLRELSQEELAKLQSKLIDLLNKQDEKQANQLKETQVDLENRHDRQTAELASVKKELTTSIEQLSADFSQQLKQTYNELSDQLERLGSDLKDRLQANQEESRQRDADLRQELLTLGAWLDDKKASRHDLGQMLIDVGQLLKQEKKASMEDPENEHTR